MEKKLVVKFTGDTEDLETILGYIGLSADTYDRVVLNAQQFIDSEKPCFITIYESSPRGLLIRLQESSESSEFLNAEEILSDLKKDRRRISIKDLENKCNHYMGYCDLCPYNKACAKILETYKNLQ